MPMQTKPDLAPPVDCIPHNWMPDKGHMHANLVSATGFGERVHQTETFRTFGLVDLYYFVGRGRFTPSAHYRHPFAFVAVSANGSIDLACRCTGYALYQREITLFHLPRLELLHE